MPPRTIEYERKLEAYKATKQLEKLERFEGFVRKTTWLSESERELVMRAVGGIRNEINKKLIQLYQEEIEL